MGTLLLVFTSCNLYVTICDKVTHILTVIIIIIYLSTQTMRLLEWVFTFKCFNTIISTQVPMYVYTLTRVLNPGYQDTQINQQCLNMDMPPDYDKGNPKSTRDWIMDWFSSYSPWTTEIDEYLYQINVTFLR